MATYTVYLPPESDKAASERARFIPDSGALLALIFPALWLLFQRLWYALVIYLLIVALLAILARTTGIEALPVISVIPAIYLFLEGRELVRRRLGRLGWRFAGVVEAEDVDEAELRWFDAHSTVEPARAFKSAQVGSGLPVTSATAPSIGIFGS